MGDRSPLLGVMIVVLAGGIVVSGPLLHTSSSNRVFARPPVPQLGTQPDFVMQIEPNQFLVKNGSSANPALVFTPLNGFSRNLTLSATVYPMIASAPRVSFNSSIVTLNASLPGSSSYVMTVSTTNRTETGMYNITVTGSSGTLSRSATATVGVTDLFVPPNSAYLLYKAHFTTIAYVGGSTVLDSTFEDLGYASIGITGLNVSLDFGTYEHHHDTTSDCIRISPGIGQGLGPCLTLPFLTIQPYQKTSFSSDNPDP